MVSCSCSSSRYFPLNTIMVVYLLVAASLPLLIHSLEYNDGKTPYQGQYCPQNHVWNDSKHRCVIIEDPEFWKRQEAISSPAELASIPTLTMEPVEIRDCPQDHLWNSLTQACEQLPDFLLGGKQRKRSPVGNNNEGCPPGFRWH